MKNILRLILIITMGILLTGGECGKTPSPDPQEEPKVAEEKVAEEKVAEEKVAEEKVAEEKVAEEKVAEQKAAEEKVAEKKVAEQKAAEEKVSEEKVAEEKVAEEKVAEQKAAEEQNAAVLAIEQKKELAKEKSEIAVEQDADKSVEAPKAVTIISAPAEETDTAVNEMELVYFDYDKSAISPAFAEIIQKNYEWIAENPDVHIQLEGHCDERGTNEYNLALGERRTKAVFDHLVSLGANPSQFTMVSFGEERPADSGSNEVAWAKNRRVEFTRL